MRLNLQKLRHTTIIYILVYKCDSNERTSKLVKANGRSSTLNSLGLKNKAKLQGYMVDALALEVYEGRDKLR